MNYSWRIALTLTLSQREMGLGFDNMKTSKISSLFPSPIPYPLDPESCSQSPIPVPSTGWRST
jgi:hypothetical protein